MTPQGCLGYTYTLIMKKELHPANYRPVVFQDLNNNTTFITRSTAETEETIEIDGSSYPLVKVHISSASHPFFTGQEKLVDVEGRVDRFKARVAAAQSKQPKSKKTQAKTDVSKKSLKDLKSKA